MRTITTRKVAFQAELASTSRSNLDFNQSDRFGKRNVHTRCVVPHAVPMALESEQHAVRDSDGAENTPAIQQPDLAGRQSLLVRVEDVVVVEKIRVQI